MQSSENLTPLTSKQRRAPPTSSGLQTEFACVQNTQQLPRTKKRPKRSFWWKRWEMQSSESLTPLTSKQRRAPATSRGLQTKFACAGAQQLPRHKKRPKRVFLVEAVGVEPTSEKWNKSLSTCLVCGWHSQNSHPQTNLNFAILKISENLSRNPISPKPLFDAICWSRHSTNASCITQQPSLCYSLRLSIFSH